ncbi:hypothetical protein JG687_00014150 [Phytophthora cactorum]|uniref:Uncharacterized protein n=1 Tax=Phytophthora cactorum TaxID=29920 RepID=A0A8T1TXA8_9STRA|nr:hypothetical protein JG687_00014150 [Phytophthora cactorum]
MKVTGRPVEVSAGETASSGKTAPEAKQGLAHLASEVSAQILPQSLYKGNILRGSGRICGGACVVERCCGELRFGCHYRQPGGRARIVVVCGRLREVPVSPAINVYLDEIHRTARQHQEKPLDAHCGSRAPLRRDDDAHVRFLCTASYRTRMEKIWTHKLLPYLRAWHSQWECQGTRIPSRQM